LFSHFSSNDGAKDVSVLTNNNVSALLDHDASVLSTHYSVNDDAKYDTYNNDLHTGHDNALYISDNDTYDNSVESGHDGTYHSPYYYAQDSDDNSSHLTAHKVAYYDSHDAGDNSSKNVKTKQLIEIHYPDQHYDSFDKK